MRRALFRRTSFERVLTQIAASFIPNERATLNERIAGVLELSGQFAGVDRSFVFMVQDPAERMELAHEWCAPGIESAKEFYRGKLLSSSPWLRGQLLRGEVVTVSDLNELPEEATFVRSLCADRGVRSFVLLPLQDEGSLIGILGFSQLKSSATWIQDHVSLLAVIGDLFLSAFRRQRASKALHDSEIRFQTLVDNFGEGIIYCDCDNKILHVNQRFAEITGYSTAELLGARTFDILIPPNDQETHRRHTERRVEGLSDRYEMELLRKDGSTFWALISATPIRAANGTVMGSLASVSDVTEQKRARQALELSEQRLRAYFQASYIGLAITGPNLEWIEINDTACRLYGYSRTELQTRSWVDLTHPDDVARDLEQYRRMVGGEINGYTIEKRYLRRDGSTWHARISVSGTRHPDGSIDYLVALIHDITQSKVAEEQVRLQREYLRSVIDTIPDLIYAKDSRGYYTLANQAVAQWYGTTPELMIGRHATEFESDPKAVERFTREDEAVLSTGKELKTSEIEIRSSVTGKTHRFESRKAILRAPDTKDIQVLGVSTDITHERAREAETMELQRRLMQSQKMDAIGQLAAGIAHDLNNSLAAVVGHLQLIGMDQTLSNTLRRSVEVALTGCDRASSLIERLLGFSRQGKYNLTSFSLSQLVRETTEFLARVIGSDVHIAWQDEREDLTVHGDSGQIQQALTNLIINARQAMPRGGSLTFRFGTRQVANPERSNPQAVPGEYATLALVDTGAGIPPSHLEKIFEPFFTTKKEREGTGLGLAMVYGILQHHGGWVEVESSLGVGTTFTVFLPRAPQHDAASSNSKSESPAAVETTSVSRGLILVIDDEPALVELACQFLKHAGFSTKGFCDTDESLTWYQDHAAEVALVVLDMKMPKMDGKEYLARLKQIRPTVRAVILSGYMQDQSTRELLELGAIRFFQKPLRYPELVSWIATLLQENPEASPTGVTLH
jgi:PAS domain S-box-containing protein